jgi:hypothetical protein
MVQLLGKIAECDKVCYITIHLHFTSFQTDPISEIMTAEAEALEKLRQNIKKFTEIFIISNRKTQFLGLFINQFIIKIIHGIILIIFFM